MGRATSEVDGMVAVKVAVKGARRRILNVCTRSVVAWSLLFASVLGILNLVLLLSMSLRPSSIVTEPVRAVETHRARLTGGRRLPHAGAASGFHESEGDNDGGPALGTFDVDPFIGTSGLGHTAPGAKYPFGMIYLTPLSSDAKDWKHSCGYQHNDRTHVGVAHSAGSGTGMPVGLDLVVRLSRHEPLKVLAERASLGFYAVTVEGGTTIELTAGVRFGVHRYTFNGSETPALFFDGSLAMVGDKICAFTTREVARYSVFMYAEIDVPCRAHDQRLEFDAKRVEMRVAISYVDEEGAHANFESEAAGFDAIRTRTLAHWNARLARAYERLNVSKPQGRVFDTALYHMFVSPYVHNDVDGRYRGPDGAVRLVENGTRFYSFLSTWDTYRTWGPIMSLVAPDVMRDIAHTSLAHFDATGSFPRWTYAGRETNCMPGMHSITLSYEAVVHGLLDAATTKRLYLACARLVNNINQTFIGDNGRAANTELAQLLRNDGLLFADGHDTQTVSQMLEYAISFHCIWKLAALHGDRRLAERMGKYRLVYRRLLDNTTNLFTGIARSGHRLVDPRPYHASNSFLFTEGSNMQWIFHEMHDLHGLIALMGRSVVRRHLSTIFETQGTYELADITGVIGMYAHGNEPSHHVAFMYYLIGEPRRAAELVAQIRAMYTAETDGLCGNDDAGQMSAWYVATTARIYPIDPTSPNMLRLD